MTPEQRIKKSNNITLQIDIKEYWVCYDDCDIYIEYDSDTTYNDSIILPFISHIEHFDVLYICKLLACIKCNSVKLYVTE